MAFINIRIPDRFENVKCKQNNIDITAQDSNWGPPILMLRNLPLDQSDPQKNLGKMSFINIRIPDRFENVKCKQNNIDITAQDSNWGPPILMLRNLPLDQSDPQKNLGKMSFINIRIPDHFENVKCKQNTMDITAQDSNWGPPNLKSRNLPLDQSDPQKNLGKISFFNIRIPYHFKMSIVNKTLTRI